MLYRVALSGLLLALGASLCTVGVFAADGPSPPAIPNPKLVKVPMAFSTGMENTTKQRKYIHP